jgi:K+-sensing histidine kinase KdpD
MQETILVCVNHPMHAARLLARGICIAEAFHGRAMILNIHPRPYDELDFNELQTKNLIQALAAKHGVGLIERVSSGGNLAATIIAAAREESATQIVIGMSAQSRLHSLFSDSLPNQLLKLKSGMDLHIVQVDRVFWSEPEFDRGQHAWLVPNKEGNFCIRLESADAAVAEGTFFRWATTEFEDGFFVPLGDDRVHVFPVNEGVLHARDWKQGK